MASYSDKINSLKLELQSVNERNLRNARKENSLRSLERELTSGVSLIQSECNFLLQQIQDKKNELSQANYQIKVTEICSVSEKSKMENHINLLGTLKQGFDDVFTKYRLQSEMNSNLIKEKLAEEEEVERIKLAEILEFNEQKAKEATAIEEESQAIERECIVLTKRNKALMLKLRRQLVEAEDTRRDFLQRKQRTANKMSQNK